MTTVVMIESYSVKIYTKYMKKKDIIVGKKVWYYPILGDTGREEAVITSEPLEMCGTTCCSIDIRSSVVDIENLEERI